MQPIFEAYPGLSARLRHVELGRFPTPVTRLERFGSALGLAALYLKHDDVSGALYGGNKVRKLEFLLARARAEGRRAVMTFGAAGSNHALATALYARAQGLRCEVGMIPQPNAHSVRRNLLMHLRAGSVLHHFPSQGALMAGALAGLAACGIRDGRLPMVIPPGGSSPLGAVGFVNAALELKQQIQDGLVPEPSVIYVAAGTLGTAIGLLLGTALAGIACRIEAVRVVDSQFIHDRAARRLFRRTNELLQRADPSVPRLDMPADRFGLRGDFYGGTYGLYTEASVAAVHTMAAEEGVRLEGTYTGKALAALMADARSGRLDPARPVLFWNTYNGVDFNSEVAGLDYRSLPKAFHRYFTQEVQELDR